MERLGSVALLVMLVVPPCLALKDVKRWSNTFAEGRSMLRNGGGRGGGVSWGSSKKKLKTSATGFLYSFETSNILFIK